MPSEATRERYERIYATIAAIPKGTVSTYGAVAREAGLGRGARQVAAALRVLPAGRKLPWQRVIQSAGTVAPRPGGGFADQVRRLRKEGVLVSDKGRVDLARFEWRWAGDS